MKAFPLFLCLFLPSFSLSPHDVPEVALLAQYLINEKYIIFAFNASAAGTPLANGIYIPDSFFQWTKTPSLSLIHPATLSNPDSWIQPAVLSRQEHGASSYWIISSHSGKWLYGQLVARRQYRPIKGGEWLTLSGLNPSPLIQLITMDLSKLLDTIQAEWEREVFLSSVLQLFGQEDIALELLKSSLSRNIIPDKIQDSLSFRFVLWSLNTGRLVEAREYIRAVSTRAHVHSMRLEWTKEAICILDILEGKFSTDETNNCADAMHSTSDFGVVSLFQELASSSHHFEIARALRTSIIR